MIYVTIDVKQTPPNFLRASDLDSHVKPMAVVPEPDISDADSHSDIDAAETPVEQLIDTSSLSSSSQVNASGLFLSLGALMLLVAHQKEHFSFNPLMHKVPKMIT